MALNISDVRQYLREQILTVISDAVEIDDPFGTKDVAISEIKKGFKIYFGETTIDSRDGGYYIDTIPTFIQIFFQESGRSIDQFDMIYNKAHEIKDAVMCPINANNNIAFNGILGNSISVLAMSTNDRGYEATISLNCLRYTDYIQE
jgi:hypothetical protein